MKRLQNLRKEDVPYLTDEELFRALQIRGKKIGPVVGSTRQLYARKLLTLLEEDKASARKKWQICEEKDEDILDAEDASTDTENEARVPLSSVTSITAQNRTVPVVRRKQHLVYTHQKSVDAPACRARNITAKPASTGGGWCSWLFKFIFILLLLLATAVLLLNYCDSLKEIITNNSGEFSLADLGLTIDRLLVESWSKAREDI